MKYSRKILKRNNLNHLDSAGKQNNPFHFLVSLAKKRDQTFQEMEIHLSTIDVLQPVRIRTPIR